METVDDARDRSRKSDARIWNAIAHRIANSYLGRHFSFAGHVLYSADERYNEAIEVRPRDVLEVTARRDAGFKSVVYY